MSVTLVLILVTFGLAYFFMFTSLRCAVPFTGEQALWPAAAAADGRRQYSLSKCRPATHSVFAE